MKKRFLLIAFMLIFSFSLIIFPITANAQELIYIKSDGSIEGTDKIQQNGDIYSFVDNVNGTIIIQKNFTILDGAGYTLQGNGMHVSGSGIQLFAQNSTIMNLQIRDYTIGIEAPYSYNSFMGNIIEDCFTGIHILGGSSNVIQHNTLRNNFHSISLVYCAGNNTITQNNIITSNSDDPMWVWLSQAPIVDQNYWNKYSGNDTDGDGIGDVPHVFREVNQGDYQDNNPLIAPIEVDPIPEFSSWAILLIIVAGLVVVTIYRENLEASKLIFKGSHFCAAY